MIGGDKQRTIGSRAEVWHGSAKKTSGGLTKSDLIKNKHGRIVSKKKHSTAKKEKRLVKAGYGTKKGHFGYVMINGKTSSKKHRGGMNHNGSSGVASNSQNYSGDSNSSSSGLSQQQKMMMIQQHNSSSGSSSMGSKMGSLKGGRKSRKRGGGKPALSPSSYDGKGVGTSGVDLQFLAGNAN